MAKVRQAPVTIDFSDTESRGGKKGARGAHLPPADYAVKCVKADLDKSSEKDTPEIVVMYQVTQGKYKGKHVRDDIYLSPKALWRLRQTLEAMGMKVPSSKVKVDPKKLLNKECAITLDDDEYEGKIRSRVVDTFLLSDFEAIETEDEDLGTDEDEEAEEGEEEETADEDLEELDLDNL